MVAVTGTISIGPAYYYHLNLFEHIYDIRRVPHQYPAALVSVAMHRQYSRDDAADDGMMSCPARSAEHQQQRIIISKLAFVPYSYLTMHQAVKRTGYEYHHLFERSSSSSSARQRQPANSSQQLQPG